MYQCQLSSRSSSPGTDISLALETSRVTARRHCDFQVLGQKNLDKQSPSDSRRQASSKLKRYFLPT